MTADFSRCLSRLSPDARWEVLYALTNGSALPNSARGVVFSGNYEDQISKEFLCIAFWPDEEGKGYQAVRIPSADIKGLERDAYYEVLRQLPKEYHDKNGVRENLPNRAASAD